MDKDNVVLIVDMNQTRRNNLSSRLRILGYQTELMSSGCQAIHRIEKMKEQNSMHFCLILLIGDSEDMPAREILLLSREIRKDKKKLPILYVHRETDPNAVIQTLQEGANDVLVEDSNEGPIVTKIQKLAPLE